MGKRTKFIALVDKLPTSIVEDKVAILVQISDILEEAIVSIRRNPSLISLHNYNFLKSTIERSNVVLELATVMESCEWATDPPLWIKDLLLRIFYRMECALPSEQVETIAIACEKYLSSSVNAVTILTLACIVTPYENRNLLAGKDQLYNMIKQALFDAQDKATSAAAMWFLQIVSKDCAEWQIKILNDKQTIRSLLDLTPIEPVWTLFRNLACHEDAKALVPGEVVDKAFESKFSVCRDVCAILSSEAGVAKITLDEIHLQTRSLHLQNLLTQNATNTGLTLFDLILPLFNLSVADANKDILGKYFIPLLLQILATKPTSMLIPQISRYLERTQQLAANILGNLAFNENNCKRILEANGRTILQSVLNKPLAQSLNGVLQMLETQKQQVVPEKQLHHEETIPGRHIFIDYNWNNQPMVLRIVKALKERGYRVWVDVEQMKGAIFEEIAAAIEKAEVALICISQRYYDSANCRAAAQYCRTRRVPIIPIMMQENFIPSGWLGFLIAGCLYYDFSHEDRFEKSLDDLVKEIGDRGKLNTSAPPPKNIPKPSPEQIQPKPTLNAIAPTPVTQRLPKDWNSEEVLAWMQAEHIDKHHAAFEHHKIDGQALAELALLVSTSYPAVLSLFALLNITEVGEILKITSALRKVSSRQN